MYSIYRDEGGKKELVTATKAFEPASQMQNYHPSTTPSNARPQ
jgi:hypothetical protein